MSNSKEFTELLLSLLDNLLGSASLDKEDSEIIIDAFVMLAMEDIDIVGYPDILVCLEELVDDDHPFKKQIIKNIVIDIGFFSLNQSLIDDNAEEITKSKYYEIVSSYVDDLDLYEELKRVLSKNEDYDYDEMLCRVKNVICILRDNNLRKKFVPYVKNTDYILKKDMDYKDISKLIIKMIKLSRRFEDAWTLFMNILADKLSKCLIIKEYTAALVLLKLLAIMYEDEFSEDRFKEDILKKYSEAKNIKYKSLKEIISRLYEENDIEMTEDLDSEIYKIGRYIMLETTGENYTDEMVAALIYLDHLIDEVKNKYESKIKSITSNIDDKPVKFSDLKNEIKDLENDISALTAQNNSYVKTINELKNQISNLEKENKKAFKSNTNEMNVYKDKINKLESDILKEKDKNIELSKLREFVYKQSLNIDYKELDINDEHEFENIVSKHKILMFGGHIKMLERIKKAYPSIDVLSIKEGQSFNEEMMKKYDLICINTNFLNHGAYYKLMNACDDYKVDYMYINNENIDIIKNNILDYYNS